MEICLHGAGEMLVPCITPVPGARPLGITVDRGWESGECASLDACRVQPGGDSKAFITDRLPEHRSFPALSKASKKRVMGHLSGREEGVKSIPRIE